MSLAAKHVALVILAAAIGVLSSWLVSEAYAPKTHWVIPAILLCVTMGGQVFLALRVQTPEERQIDLLREALTREMQSKIHLSAVIDERIEADIRTGDLKSAKKWDDYKKSRK